MLDVRESSFWRAAIRSGLMGDETLSACWEAIDPAKRDDPGRIERRLARQAVQSGFLTPWQAHQLLAGRTGGYMVDRYRLLDLIGQGGMGRVYLARDTRLDRPVALKILSPERLSNPRAVTRFQREARVGARLQHENLVRIYDFGESGGRYFLVMEYIEGKTIGTLIAEQGPVPPATAARLVRQVALGLEHAHRKGLIHRDVNPFNILVTDDGIAKLADLGLAVILDEEERITRDGAAVGTFDYVAPEQAKDSRAADARSDVYSLGCTMYHMCAGQVPFPGPSLPEKLLGHQTIDPAPLSRRVPGFPEGLSEVVRRMMRKSPGERYATPTDVARALAPYADDDARAASRAGDPPILVPLGVGPSAPATAATRPDSETTDSDPAVPILTPDDDVAAEDVRLILDPDPAPSPGGRRSPPRPRSSSGHHAPVDLAARRAGWLTPARFWGFVVLAAATMVLILVLAMVNARGDASRRSETGRASSPARDQPVAALTRQECRGVAQHVEDLADCFRPGGGRSLETTLSPHGLEERAMFRDQPSTPLGPIGLGLSSLTRRRCCGLLMLAPMGMVVPTLRGAPAPIQDDADRARGERKALDDFLEAYRLAPGQLLKRVPTPRPEGVRAWWKQKYPTHGNRPDQFGAMVFRWRDPDRLDNWGGTTAEGYSLRQLLRNLHTEIYEAEIDGDRDLLETKMNGDWVFRDGVEAEQKVHALETIIQRVLRLRIALTFRRVERDVVVARGAYHHTPLNGRAADVIEIYGKEVVPGGGGAGGGSGDFAMFLKWVGEWIGRPVVSDVEPAPKQQVTWYYNHRAPFTDQMRREDHDEASVLRHLQEQTGLKFTRERRPIRVLFIERAR
jgi:serine/threonine protein kinase